MSLVRIIEVPEVEMEVSKLVNQRLHLCQGYRQVQMRFFSDELNLPKFARMFELIRQIEVKHVEELIRFQITRGQKITWFDVKPVENIENSKPMEILTTILDLEKKIHQLTTKLNKLSWEKNDIPLTAFLEDQVLLRQVKIIRKRANQLRDLTSGNDNVTPFLVDRLNIRYEVEKLEKRLRLEILRSETETKHSHENMLVCDREISMIGSTNRF